jgi:plasmid stability protein
MSRDAMSREDVMSTSITIGEVPDDVREELAARAALSGRTLEEYVREELIALTRRPSAAVWMARVRARKEALLNPPNAAGNTEATGEEGRSVDRPSEPRAVTAPLAPHQRDVG